MRGTFHLVQYKWGGNLFNKKGVSKSGIFSPNDDPVISCTLSGRKAYLHPASGLAFIKGGLGKTVENVVEGVSWEGPQYIRGESVDRFLTAVQDREDFGLFQEDVTVEKEEFNPSSISEAANGPREYSELSEAFIHRTKSSRPDPESWYDVYDGDKIEFFRGKARAGTDIHCASLLQMIAESMDE